MPSNANLQTQDLFQPAVRESSIEITEAAMLLRGFALTQEQAILKALENIVSGAKLRHMQTPGGHSMSVAMTNCGKYGWVTDHKGYRYDSLDPLTGEPWPVMPKVFIRLANDAAAAAGFKNFIPDACLINRYEPKARMSLHQDKNEKDFSQPIVSVSLGVPARFLFGGFTRKDKPEKITLYHGDVLVWGGPDRMRFHGVMPLKKDHHPAFGPYRFNLTFRGAV